MTSNASDYADRIAREITAAAEAGSPFGWINPDTDEHTMDAPETDDDRATFDEASAGDYLSDVLDIQHLIGSDRQYRAARILIACGGPTAWIDTRTGQLEVTWWSAPEVRTLPAAFIDGLDDYLSEVWEAGA
jgi:hypothetical protein